jgi:hypothetical protein
VLCLVVSVIALRAQNNSASVCWDQKEGKGGVCVPVEVMRATFPTYTEGQASPLTEARQVIHDLQNQLLTTRDQLSQAQHQLLVQDQLEINAAFVAAAPEGYVWDASTHAYKKKS